VSTLRFLSNWTLQQDGEQHAGEPLRIEYDVARLPACRASYRGQDAWSIAGYVRFHPGAEVESVGLKSGSAEVDVPENATRIELWFNNTDNTGCVAWDSSFGRNYWLDVTAA
jgi:Family of unknown function (DUF6209)